MGCTITIFGFCSGRQWRRDDATGYDGRDPARAGEEAYHYTHISPKCTRRVRSYSLISFHLSNVNGVTSYLGCRRSHWFHTIMITRAELDRAFSNTTMKSRSVLSASPQGLLFTSLTEATVLHVLECHWRIRLTSRTHKTFSADCQMP